MRALPSRFRYWLAALLAGTAAVGGGAILLTSADEDVRTGATAPATPAAKTFNVGVTTGACDTTPTPVSPAVPLAELPRSALACTIDQAWDAVPSCGAIGIRNGSYTSTLQGVSGDKTCTTKIIGESKAGVLIGGQVRQCPVHAGTIGDFSAFCSEADHMWLQDVTVDSGDGTGVGSATLVWPGTDDVTFKNVDFTGDFPSVNIRGDRVRYLGGMIGDDLPHAQQPMMTCTNGAWIPLTFEPSTTWTPSTAAVIDGVRFNPRKDNRTAPQPNQGTCSGDQVGVIHLETVRANVDAADFWTIKNSVFVRGSDIGSGHIFWSTDVTGAKVVGNFFGKGNSFYWAQLGAGTDNTFAYNTFEQPGSYLSTTGYVWVGNFGAPQGCGGTHIKNRWSGTGSCGTDTYFGSKRMGVDERGAIGPDSPAIGAGETTYCEDPKLVGSADRDGDARPAAGQSSCAAGADERASRIRATRAAPAR